MKTSLGFSVEWVAWCIFAVIFSCPLASSAEQNARKEDLAHKVMDARGLNNELGSLRSSASEGMNEDLGQDKLKAFRKAIEENFTTAKLRAAYERAFIGSVNVQDLEEALKWYETDLAKKVVALESKEYDAQSLNPGVAKYSEELKKKPVSSGRSQLVADIEKARRAVDLSVDILVNVRKSIVLGVLAGRGPRQKIDHRAVNAALSKMRNEIRASMKKTFLVTYLWIYRDLSDAELKAYLEFLKSKPGRSVNDAAFYALNESLETGASGVGAELGR